MVRFGLFLCVLMLSMTGLCQTRLDTLVQALNQQQQVFPQEKIYLHIDRPYYAPGDTIWFRPYLEEASSHAIDSASKNIYVDFFRKEDGRIVRQLLLKNEGGFSAGSIPLADSLKEGVYEIRAYTRWMRNFSAHYFFHKEIFIRNKYDVSHWPSRAEIAVPLEVADLQFFPEGGNLVAGLQNRVAFKSVNPFGLGTDFKAFILSEHQDTVATIQSQHLGMGSFILKPIAGEKYFAVIVNSGTKRFSLPEAQPFGYTLFVDNLSNPKLIKVIARNNYSEKDQPILVGHQRGNVVFAMQSKSVGNTFLWTFPKEDISQNGVIHLTLFNGKGIPQSERLIYHGTEVPVQVEISSSKNQYARREKVSLSILVKDDEGNPVAGNFSIAVTDSKQVTPEFNGGNIFTYLYLTSDLHGLQPDDVHGTIEQPSYYFDQSNLNAVVHLDILLMTQGWRRFLWQDIIIPKRLAPKYDLETGIGITGKVLLPSGRKSVKPADITLMYSQEKEATVFLKTKSDEAGKFSFSNLTAINETKVFLQSVRDKGGRDLVLSVDKPDFPSIQSQPGLIDPFFLKPEAADSFLLQQEHLREFEEKLKKGSAQVLKELTVSAKREKVVDSRKTMYDETNATTIKVSGIGCTNVFSVLQLLQSRVAGLEIALSPTGGYDAFLTRISRFGGKTRPTIMVDGVITDIQFLNAITPCSVESIDVVVHPVAILNAPGLISILTKGRNPNYDYSESIPPGSLSTTIHGYDVTREFYSPRYPVNDALSSNKLPDIRSTLYWNPAIKTDLDGKATVEFWNSDESTKVHVVLEGVSSEGKPGFATYQYRVN